MSLAKPEQLAMAGAPWHAVVFLPVGFGDSGHRMFAASSVPQQKMKNVWESKET